MEIKFNYKYKQNGNFIYVMKLITQSLTVIRANNFHLFLFIL